MRNALACALFLALVLACALLFGCGTSSVGIPAIPLLITTTSLPDGTVGQPYNQTVTASGGVAPFTWSVTSGSLPAGLTLNATAGAILGTPIGPTGTASFTLQVRDSASPAQTRTINLSIRIADPLLITTTTLPDGTVGQPFNQSITSTGGTSPFAWSEPTGAFDNVTGAGSAGTACEGLALDLTATGSSTSISGTPVRPGTCGPFTLEVRDSGSPARTASRQLDITVVTGIGVIERVSVASDGTQGNHTSSFPSTGADGRFVAFESSSSNLVAGDTNGNSDVFVRDTCLGAVGCTPSTVRVSVASDGTQGNGISFSPSISADGRFVAFFSGAENLVPADTNAAFDVFLRDTCVGTAGCTPSTVRVSVPSDGTQGNGDNFRDSLRPSISADGRFVAFHSDARNLVAGDTNGTLDVFVRDTCLAAAGCTRSTLRVSVASDGSQGDSSSFNPSISADGRFVAFDSFASNLVAGDTNATQDIFVRDTCVEAVACTPTTIRVSVANDGTQGNRRSFGASISADGRFIAFTSLANNLVAGDTSVASDVFVRDTCLRALGCTPSTIQVSVASDGAQGNDAAGSPSISADGRFVAFQSSATDLVAGDTNGRSDIFLHDTCVGTPPGCALSTIRVSVASDGTQADNHSFFPSISADGRFVAFYSSASNLVPNDTNNALDVFLARTGL